MPGRRLVYFADDAAFPYGAWDEAALAAHIRALFGELVAACRPCLAVIACNTASTLVLAELRAAHPGMPFVGTVPAIKPAAERTRVGADLGAGDARHGEARLYGRADPQSSRGMPRAAGRLRRLAAHGRGVAARRDAGRRGRSLDEIAPCFVEEEGRRTDIVVLACTHYPFLANRFRRLAPWPVDWLDPAEAIAPRARLAAAAMPRQRRRWRTSRARDLAVFTAGAPDTATRALIRGFGLDAGTMSDLVV